VVAGYLDSLGLSSPSPQCCIQ